MLDLEDKDEDPVGLWTFSGNWRPDFDLNMSVQEQIDHNMEHGFFNENTPIWQVTVH